MPISETAGTDTPKDEYVKPASLVSRLAFGLSQVEASRGVMAAADLTKIERDMAEYQPRARAQVARVFLAVAVSIAAIAFGIFFGMTGHALVAVVSGNGGLARAGECALATLVAALCWWGGVRLLDREHTVAAKHSHLRHWLSPLKPHESETVRELCDKSFEAQLILAAAHAEGAELRHFHYDAMEKAAGEAGGFDEPCDAMFLWIHSVKGPALLLALLIATGYHVASTAAH